MKQLLSFTLLFLVFSGIYAQDSVATFEDEKTIWSLSYKEALKQAKKENKPLLVYFKGSDWCGPCKKLDKDLFSTEKFKDLSEKHFVLYEADIPMNQDLVTPDRLALNKMLASKFKVSSYPTLLFLNGRQKVLGIKKGLILTEYYYPFFKEIINN